jgi:hypothetical protein
MPKGYISAKSASGMVPWSRAEELLERASGYWLSTTDPDGTPHLVQQWGAWVEDRLVFEGSSDARWARNLARDARAAVSVERGSEIVIVYGTARLNASVERRVLESAARAYARKYARTYRYKPSVEDFERRGVHVFEPSKALSWDVKRFGTSPTRFLF